MGNAARKWWVEFNARRAGIFDEQRRQPFIFVPNISPAELNLHEVLMEMRL